MAGYLAASTMSLYLVVKVGWVAAGLFGHGPKDVGTAGWIALNTVTVGMSAVGVAVGLALAQPWGGRLPARPLILFSWLGTGFLVPMLPFMVISTILDAAGVDRDGSQGGAGQGGGGQAPPGWEMALIGIGFFGMAVGLAVGLPIYLRERWPYAFLGRVGEVRSRPSWFTSPAIVVAVALGLLWLYWAAGGTLGLDRWDLTGQMLNGSAGLWALIGAWSVHVLRTGRPARLPLWLPMTLAFAASGSLFAWACWKLPMVFLKPGDYTSPEHPPVAVAEYVLSIAVGAALLATTLSAVRRR